MDISGCCPIAGTDSFLNTGLKIMAQERGIVSRDSAFICAGINKAINIYSSTGMRIYDGERQPWPR